MFCSLLRVGVGREAEVKSERRPALLGHHSLGCGELGKGQAELCCVWLLPLSHTAIVSDAASSLGVR